MALSRSITSPGSVIVTARDGRPNLGGRPGPRRTRGVAFPDPGLGPRVDAGIAPKYYSKIDMTLIFFREFNLWLSDRSGYHPQAAAETPASRGGLRR